MKPKPSRGFEHHPQRRIDMKKFLTIVALLTVAGTPALAQSSADRGAVVKHQTQIERGAPTNGQSNYFTFDDLHAGGGF
jgi:hypothetical protein